MQLFVKSPKGNSIPVTVQDGATTTTLKTIVEDRFGIPAAVHGLSYGGRRLQSSRCLSAYGMQSDCMVDVVLPLLGGKADCGFAFASLDQGRLQRFLLTAPTYRVIRRGFNVEGKCTNEDCKACGRLVWSNLGFKYSKDDSDEKLVGFNIGEMIGKIVCPLCKEPLAANSIKSCGFYSCKYMYEGFASNTNEAVEGHGIAKASDRFEHHQGEVSSANWTYLKISVAPLDDSTEPSKVADVLKVVPKKIGAEKKRSPKKARKIFLRVKNFFR